MLKKIKEYTERRLHGEHAGFWKFALISTLAIFAFMLLGPGNNLINWARSEIEIREQSRLMRKYNSEIKAMEDSIRLLRSNKDSLEKYARESFHFAEPGDDVYLIED